MFRKISTSGVRHYQTSDEKLFTLPELKRSGGRDSGDDVRWSRNTGDWQQSSGREYNDSTREVKLEEFIDGWIDGQIYDEDKQLKITMERSKIDTGGMKLDPFDSNAFCFSRDLELEMTFYKDIHIGFEESDQEISVYRLRGRKTPTVIFSATLVWE